MHIGVHTPSFYQQPLSAAIEYLDGIGVDAIEPGVGGHPGDDHLPPWEYLDDEARQDDSATASTTTTSP
jgi:hypothetical protein